MVLDEIQMRIGFLGWNAH